VSTNGEVFVSVDVETTGPIPGEYSLLSIGRVLYTIRRGRFRASSDLEGCEAPGFLTRGEAGAFIADHNTAPCGKPP
jgi:hypothetical protein